MAEIPSLAGKRVQMMHDGFSYGGQQRDMGEIFALRGELADERNLRLLYVTEVSEKVRGYKCGACQRLFVTEDLRNRHGGHRHPDYLEQPSGDDASVLRKQEAEQRRMNESFTRNPIALEKTKASLTA